MTIAYDEFMFRRDMEKLTTMLTGRPIDRIVALSRGGLIPGVVLSHNLGVPLHAMNWSKTHRQEDDWLYARAYAGERWLVVDDMVDTGELLGQLFESLNAWDGDDRPLRTQNIQVATLYNNLDVGSLYENETGSIECDYWARDLRRSTNKSWIIYWWERQLT